jgi:hypothetical protein
VVLVLVEVFLESVLKQHLAVVEVAQELQQ